MTLLGSEDALSKISSIETSPIDVSQYGDDSEVSTVLKIPDGVSLASNDQAQIKVKLDFSKDAQKEIEVPVTTEGTLDGYTPELDTKTIKVTINGPEDSVNSIDLSKFKCTIDISKLTADGGSVKPNISNSYDNIKVVSINPTEVKVTFKKNTDSTESTENNSTKPSDNSNNNNNTSNGSNNENSNNKQ